LARKNKKYNKTVSISIHIRVKIARGSKVEENHQVGEGKFKFHGSKYL